MTRATALRRAFRADTTCEYATGDISFHGGGAQADMSGIVSWSLRCVNERFGFDGRAA